MSPDRVTALVGRWVRLYTAGLPAPVASRRREEIAADLADHLAHHRAEGVDDGRIARTIASRAVRGALADVSWRHHELGTARTRNEDRTMTASLTRPALRVSAFVLAVLAIPAVGMAVSEDVDWGVFDFVLAGVLLAAVGACVEAAVRTRGTVLGGAAVAVLGVAAAILGEADDAPGLILLGGLLVAGGAALAYRRMAGVR
ncbi:MAG: hypothetical protein ACLGIC_05735 [Acidimicrobiia bacterium]